MQRELFHDLGYQLKVLTELQSKISHLQDLAKLLSRYETEVQVIVKYKVNDIPAFYDLEQDLFPFDIKNEIKVLISDSIDSYQQSAMRLNNEIN